MHNKHIGYKEVFVCVIHLLNVKHRRLLFLNDSECGENMPFGPILIILFNKFDGKVDLSVPPFDHLTSAPLYKKDVKFKIEWMYIRDELVRIKTFINSNLRSTIEY